MDQDLDRLFIKTGSWDVRQFTVFDHKGKSSFRSEDVLDHEHLKRLLSVLKDNDCGLSMTIIRQQNSWGRLRISQHSFQQIVSFIQACDRWWYFIRLFGFKASRIDEDFGGYDRHSVSIDGSGHIQHDLCYNIRYPERIDRPQEYPWVHRQLAVYHSCHLGSHKSRWVLLQPSVLIESEIKRLLAQLRLPKSTSELDYQWLVHSLILGLTESKWRDYINHLEQEVGSFNEKACFSRVGRPSKYDYILAFSDSQDFQQTRGRLLRARSAIDQTSETLVGFQDHFFYLGRRGMLLRLDEVKSRIKVFQSKMRIYKRAIDRLLDVSDGISRLLLEILDFRHDETTQRESAITHATLEQSEKHAQALFLAAKDTQVESRSMRILTWTTIIYLPANLVAAIFSTNIVQYDGDTGSTSSSQLRSYIGITFGLMVMTIALSSVWERGGWTILTAKGMRVFRRRQADHCHA